MTSYTQEARMIKEDDLYTQGTCDEWDRVVALPRHKFVTGATLLQLGFLHQ
jgi:hypothetical protein